MNIMLLFNLIIRKIPFIKKCNYSKEIYCYVSCFNNMDNEEIILHVEKKHKL